MMIHADELRKLTECGVDASDLSCDTDELTPAPKAKSTYGRVYPKPAPKPALRQVKPVTETLSGSSWWLFCGPEGFTSAAERRLPEMSSGPAADKVSSRNFVGFSGTGE